MQWVQIWSSGCALRLQSTQRCMPSFYTRAALHHRLMWIRYALWMQRKVYDGGGMEHWEDIIFPEFDPAED